MTCKCFSPSSCNRTEKQACVEAACEKGTLLNQSWQTKASAEKCAQKWTKEYRIPHVIKTADYSSGDVSGSIDEYKLVKCDLGDVYKKRLENNQVRAEKCARAWNKFTNTNNYIAELVKNRLFFSDTYKVVKADAAAAK